MKKEEKRRVVEDRRKIAGKSKGVTAIASAHSCAYADCYTDHVSSK